MARATPPEGLTAMAALDELLGHALALAKQVEEQCNLPDIAFSDRLQRVRGELRDLRRTYGAAENAGVRDIKQVSDKKRDKG